MTENKHLTIAFLDSGVGGLSVLEHVQNKIPSAKYVYFMDNAFFPYSLLEENFLIDRVLTISQYLVQNFAPDFIVVACNTASTSVLSKLRNTVNIPIVGVVPAIKPAVTLSKSKVIGILATPATIQRPYLNDLIHSFAPLANIIKIGSTKLVRLAEKKLAGKPISLTQIETELVKFIEIRELDSIVLACTHFPHLLNELKEAAPMIDHWVDSGEAIANRLYFLSKGISFLGTNNIRNQTIICYSKNSNFVKLHQNLFPKRFDSFRLSTF